MPYSAPLELLTDSSGSVTFGWVDEGVLYARFSRGLSAELGAAYASRLQSLVGEAPRIDYFGDSRLLEHYDLLARSAILRAILAQRRKYSSIYLLTWSGEKSSATASSLGDGTVITTDPDVFEARLFATAPSARWKLDTRPDARGPVRLLHRRNSRA